MPSALETAVRAWRQRLLAYERAPMQQMQAVYEESWRRLQWEIDRYTQRIEQGDPLLPGLLHRRQAAQEAQQAIANEIERLNRLAEGLTVQMQQSAVSQSHQSMQEMARVQADVWLRRPNYQAIESLIGFASDGSPLYDVLAHASRGQARAMADLLARNVALGINPRATARQMRDQFGTVLRRAQTIARTETVRAFREASHLSMEANDDVIDGWIWISALSARTCFPAGTMIETSTGKKPIENVRVDDMVLTHAGRYRRVAATSGREYNGTMTTIRSADKEITSTADHPFLSSVAEQSEWVAAGDLKEGGIVYLLSDGSKQDGSHFGINLTIEGRRVESHNPKPLGFQFGSFLCVLARSFAMFARSYLTHRGLATRFGAITSCVSSALNAIGFSAAQTGMLRGWLGRTARSASVRMRALINAITCGRTEPLLVSSSMRWRQIERFATLATCENNTLIETFAQRSLAAIRPAIEGKLSFKVADVYPGVFPAHGTSAPDLATDPVNLSVFQEEIISHSESHSKGNITVYNFEVEDDHTYVANGFVVHNCVACYAMHNTWHPNSERLQDHPNGACAAIPHIRGMPKPIPDGGERFAQLPPEQQRAALGRAKYDAWRDGAFDFRDLAGAHHSDRWGNSVRERSLASLVGEGRAREYIGATRSVVGGDSFAQVIEALKPFVERVDATVDISGYDALESEYNLMRANYNKLQKEARALGKVSEFYDSNVALERRYLKAKYSPERREYLNQIKKINREARSAVYVADPIQWQGKLVSGRTLANVNEGFAEFGKLVSSKVTAQYEIEVELGARRAHAAVTGTKISISSKESIATIVHELGHALEFRNSDISSAAREFLEKRTDGETSKWLGKPYRRDEKAKFDKFIDPYVGKQYPTGTEVISMGLQYMYDRPVEFYQKDPDMFEFIFRLLRGIK